MNVKAELKIDAAERRIPGRNMAPVRGWDELAAANNWRGRRGEELSVLCCLTCLVEDSVGRPSSILCPSCGMYSSVAKRVSFCIRGTSGAALHVLAVFRVSKHRVCFVGFQDQCISNQTRLAHLSAVCSEFQPASFLGGKL